MSYLKNHMRSLAFDRSFYVIVCRGRDGEPYAAEQCLSDMTAERLVINIASGQIENVRQVFEFNPAEGWSRDVSEDIARDVLRHCFAEDDEITAVCFDFVEDQLGCRVVADAIREVA